MKALSWSLVALAACSGHSSSVSPDASPDAAEGPPTGPLPPESGPISVYAPYFDLSSQDAHPGATVLVYTSDGVLVDRQVTDSRGFATAMAPPDATVTVTPPATQTQLYSWVGVEPSDNLSTTSRPTGITPTNTVDVIVPHDDNALWYLAESGGLGGVNDMPPASGNVTIKSRIVFDAPARNDLVASVHEAARDRFIVAHDADLSAATVDLSAAAWTAAVPLDFEIDHMPADLRWAEADYLMKSGGRELWRGTALPPSLTSTTWPVHIDSPGPVGDGRALKMFSEYGHTPDHYWTLAFNGQPAGAVDLASVWPPDVSPVTLGDGDQATWQTQGNAALATGELLTLATDSARWSIMLPGDRRTYSPPRLPLDLPVFNGSLRRAGVEVFGTNLPAGYDDVRTSVCAFDSYAYGQQMPDTDGAYRIGRD